MSQCIGNVLINIAKNFTKVPVHRSFSQSSIKYSKALAYNGYGEPVNVLHLTDYPDEVPGEQQVAVKWLLSPVNPADINILQGKYPSRPTLPATGGNEGVGEILEVGANVKDFNVGDRVIPNATNIGTWCTRGVYDASNVLKIPNSLSPIQGSMLNVNPCTAYRLLKDFVDLKSCETVIQNGANSAVGQFVTQLCSIWNYRCINIIRDKCDVAATKNRLVELGATEVLTVAELRSTELFKRNQLPAPRLALNCVCGDNAVEVLRQVAPNGTMVTYGAMSREPLTAPASALIFKNITLKGFWMTQWTKEHSESQERVDMFNDLANLFHNKRLEVPPHKIVPLSEFKEAVGNTLKRDGGPTIKYILDLTA